MTDELRAANEAYKRLRFGAPVRNAPVEAIHAAVTADLTPAQAARLEAIEAAPWAEEALQERLAVALHAADWSVPWPTGSIARYRRLADAAIDVMRGATDDGAIGRVQLCPKCNGQGTVAKPPWIPGDVHQWSSGTLSPHRCNLCDGRMVIGAPATAEGDDRG